MRNFIRLTTLWLWGGFIYYLIELLWRGYSHPSMFIVGGLCLIGIGMLNNYLPWSMGFPLQMLIGTGLIITLELICGLIVNVWLGLNVWDYSHLRFNFLGQISFPFCLVFVPLAAFAIRLDDSLRYYLFNEEKPHYSWRSTR